jgi:lysophospholipase L1-like esterase
VIWVRRFVVAVALAVGMAVALPGVTVEQQARGGGAGGWTAEWTASWASSMMRPEPENNQPGIDAAKLTDATVRQVVHLSAGGSQVRLVLSNAWSAGPLVVDSVHVALVKSSAQGVIDPASDHAATFGGRSWVSLPPMAEYLSDPIAMPVGAESDLAVSFHLAEPPQTQTLHAGSRATTFLLHGNHSADAVLTGAETVEHWYNLAEVDVAESAGRAGAARTVVCFGDSITDGHASTTNGNDRWPDELARRIAADPALRGVGVANEGIGGNHLLTDGLGENALGRLDRDVLAVSGVRWVLVLEGINDLGMLARGKIATPEQHAQLVAAMESAYAQIVARAHAHRLRVIGATMTPFVGSGYYAPTPANEADRVAVNAWILTPGHFDAVIDFDAVMCDPQHPERLLPAYDSGDHLHPGPAGYKAMGDAVPLALFR